MCNAGLIPERTPDPGRAFHLWSSDGAVILTSNCPDAGGMLAGAREVFGPRILAHQLPTTVVTNPTPGQATYYDPVTRTVNANADISLEVQIDGYMTFGDHYPDLVFVLCERQATTGGEWFLVDGQRLVGAIASDPALRSLSSLERHGLWTAQRQRPGTRAPRADHRAVALKPFTTWEHRGRRRLDPGTCTAARH
jgi:hypothetical protein